jgi:hypothetical protein
VQDYDENDEEEEEEKRRPHTDERLALWRFALGGAASGNATVGRIRAAGLSAGAGSRIGRAGLPGRAPVARSAGLSPVAGGLAAGIGSARAPPPAGRTAGSTIGVSGAGAQTAPSAAQQANLSLPLPLPIPQTRHAPRPRASKHETWKTRSHSVAPQTALAPRAS